MLKHIARFALAFTVLVTIAAAGTGAIAAALEPVSAKIRFDGGGAARSHVRLPVQVALLSGDGRTVTPRRCLCAMDVYDRGDVRRGIISHTILRASGSAELAGSIVFPRPGRYLLVITVAPPNVGAFEPARINVDSTVR